MQELLGKNAAAIGPAAARCPARRLGLLSVEQAQHETPNNAQAAHEPQLFHRRSRRRRPDPARDLFSPSSYLDVNLPGRVPKPSPQAAGARTARGENSLTPPESGFRVGRAGALPAG